MFANVFTEVCHMCVKVFTEVLLTNFCVMSLDCSSLYLTIK